MRRRASTNGLKAWRASLRASFKLAGAAASASRRMTSTAVEGLSSPAKKRTTRKGTKARAKPAPNSNVRDARSRATKRVAGGTVARFRNAYGSRSYILFPAEEKSTSAERPPLIVMLHGCGQSADQFAETTRMANRAAASGCWLVFPEQSDRSHAGRCWQWFEPEHQRRDAGEPAILAGLAKSIARRFKLDTKRLFVAGLSAGGAMAVVLGRTYPDVFRGVAAYAGMPYAAASSAASAMLAMRGRTTVSSELRRHEPRSERPVRTIVFHGNRDRVVALRNADRVVAQALEPFGETNREVERGRSAGRAFERIRYVTSHGTVAVEQWTVAGGSHAWSGGAGGRFSDPSGPEASQAILDFFMDDAVGKAVA